MPTEFVSERLQASERDFGPTKDEFLRSFEDLVTEQDVLYLDFISALRNAIAHSHVTISDRGYFLYRPSRRSETAALGGLAPEVPSGKTMEPKVIRLDFREDWRYLRAFAAIRRLDEQCLATVADSLEVRHSRIR